MTAPDTGAEHNGPVPSWTDMTDQMKPYEGETDRAWVVLYPEDYATRILDAEDNLGLLVNEEQARELKRLAEQAIEHAGGDPDAE